MWKNNVIVVNMNPVPEVKKVKVAVLISNQVMPNSTEEKHFPEFQELERFNHSSSLGCLKRSIVRFQRMIEKNRPNKQHISRPASGTLTVEEMHSAEEVIIKSVQYWYFGKEIH